MKRYILPCSILIALIAALSCENFLEKRPYGQIIDGDQEAADPQATRAAGVFKAYSELKSWGVGVFPWIGISSVTSDDADKGSSPGDSPDMIQMETFTFNANHPFVNDFYKANYNGVTQCNIALRDLNLIEGEAADLEQLKAEARFLRAYYYFNLARVFGGVSIVDRVFNQNEKTPPRSSLAETYAFIETDLLYAMERLPLKSEYEVRWAGRATRGAAEALLAKMYLYNQEWSKALGMTTSIIESNQYDLNTPYADIFKEAFENGSESVFEAQAETREGFFGLESQYAEVQGVRGPLDLGWGFNNPSEALLAAYEPGDPRKNATVVFRGTTMEDGRLIPAGAENPYYNKKVYQWLFEAENHPLFPKSGWINSRIIRYADVVLMHAEAANELGQSAEALAKLEMIRSRARAGNNAILPKIETTSTEELRDKIRHERRIELAMEHERYFDLVRWNIARDILGAKWDPAKHKLFPIPQSEIDNSNGIITQNPGYN